MSTLAKKKEALKDLQKALQGFFNHFDEWFDPLCIPLSDVDKGNKVREEIGKLQELFSVFQVGQAAKEQALRELLKNRPILVTNVYPENAMTKGEEPLLERNRELKEWFKLFEKKFDEAFSEDYVCVSRKQLSEKLSIAQEMWNTAKATSESRHLTKKQKEVLQNHEYVGNTLAYAHGRILLLKELLEASSKRNCRDCIQKYGKDGQILWYCPEGKTPETCEKAEQK